jgi:hypothetical protein
MIRSLSLAALIFLAPGFASAQCIADLTDTRGLFGNLIAALTPVSPKEASACDSLRLVLGKLTNNKRMAGRQLEGDKPLDEAAAQKDLQAARRDPVISSRIEKIRRDVADENARLALEAAVLDEEGHYGGRELLIRQLRQRLN